MWGSLGSLRGRPSGPPLEAGSLRPRLSLPTRKLPRPLVFSGCLTEEDIMKAFSPSSLVLYFTLAVTGLGLLGNPPGACAESGTAKCGATTVKCNAPHCQCVDGMGCIAYDENWQQISGGTQLCSSNGEFAAVESNY